MRDFDDFSADHLVEKLEDIFTVAHHDKKSLLNELRTTDYKQNLSEIVQGVKCGQYNLDEEDEQGNNLLHYAVKDIDALALTAALLNTQGNYFLSRANKQGQKPVDVAIPEIKPSLKKLAVALQYDLIAFEERLRQAICNNINIMLDEGSSLNIAKWHLLNASNMEVYLKYHHLAEAYKKAQSKGVTVEQYVNAKIVAAQALKAKRTISSGRQNGE